MRLKPFLLFALFLAAAARGQGDFRVYAGSEHLIESGRVETLTVLSSNRQFILRPPRGWSRQVDAAGQKIVFTTTSGRSAVTVQFTTNAPGTLPAEEVLRGQVLRAHPGAAVVQYAVCSTSYRPGVLFDLVRVPSPGLVQRLRHAFVAQPDGEVEFILAASDDEFGRGKIALMNIVATFRVEAPRPKLP